MTEILTPTDALKHVAAWRIEEQEELGFALLRRIYWNEVRSLAREVIEVIENPKEQWEEVETEVRNRVAVNEFGILRQGQLQVLTHASGQAEAEYAEGEGAVLPKDFDTLVETKARAMLAYDVLEQIRVTLEVPA